MQQQIDTDHSFLKIELKPTTAAIVNLTWTKPKKKFYKASNK